jgi:hypothetical protein
MMVLVWLYLAGVPMFFDGAFTLTEIALNWPDRAVLRAGPACLRAHGSEDGHREPPGGGCHFRRFPGRHDVGEYCATVRQPVTSNSKAR